MEGDFYVSFHRFLPYNQQVTPSVEGVEAYTAIICRGIFIINDALPIVAQPEGEHFLELEIAVVLFRQVHTIVETGMEEYLGRQITTYLEVQGIFPVGYYFLVSSKVVELGSP